MSKHFCVDCDVSVRVPKGVRAPSEKLVLLVQEVTKLASETVAAAVQYEYPELSEAKGVSSETIERDF